MTRDLPDFRHLTPAEWIAAAEAMQRDDLPVHTEADNAAHDEAERRHDEAEHMSDRELDWLASRAEDAETRMHERRQASADRRWVS